MTTRDPLSPDFLQLAGLFWLPDGRLLVGVGGRPGGAVCVYDPALDILTRAAGIDTVYSVSPHGEVLGARVTHTHGTGGVPAPVVWRDGAVDSFVFGDSAWRPVGEVIPSTEVASLEAISGDNRTLLAVSAAAEGSRLVTADAGTAGWNSWLRPGELKGTSGTYNIAAVIPTPAEETP